MRGLRFDSMSIWIASARGAAWRQRFLAIARQVEAGGVLATAPARPVMRPRLPARSAAGARPAISAIA